MNIKNAHLVEITYHGPTDHEGSRIKLYSPRLKETKWLSYDYAESDIIKMAINHLQSLPLKAPILAQCETKNGYALILESVDGSFSPIK